MKVAEELAEPSTPGMTGEGSPSDADRAFLLECRLEQMRATVDEARAEANHARTALAVSAVREADHARRHQLVLEELALARGETTALHRRLEHSEALRARLEGRLFESDTPGDARELVRLRGEVAAARELVTVHGRTSAELRARVEALVASREALLSRVVEWQRMVQEGDVEAVDLAEFIAVLRRDILDLEHRNAMGERREADLRERLGLGARKVEADGRPIAASPVARPESSTGAESKPTESPLDHLARLGEGDEDEAFYSIRSSLGAAEPEVRAAAYQALGRLLERDPSRLEPHLRWGFADPDPRVRRRAVLAASAARGLDLRPLLDPLRRDPDPQVRRLVSEVLRRAPVGSPGAGTSTDAAAFTNADASTGAGTSAGAERHSLEEIPSGVAS